MTALAPSRAPERRVRVRLPFKILGFLLLVVIGVPLLGIASFQAWAHLSDKTNGTIESSGVTRRYLLYVPPSYDRSKPTPLVISFHPAASWPAAERSLSRWNDLADEHGFLVVYPGGSSAFSEGFGPGPHIWPMGRRGTARDVKFISDLIDKLSREYNIDSSRIYADGISNGGGMAFALGCQLPDRIAAVAGIASALLDAAEICSNAKPIPMMQFHGTGDHWAPYLGGPSGDPVNPQQFPAIREWATSWAQRNHCDPNPTDAPAIGRVRRLTFTNCPNHADVVLYTIDGGGHQWPGGYRIPEFLVGPWTDDINATRTLWDFYMQHPRLAR